LIFIGNDIIDKQNLSFLSNSKCRRWLNKSFTDSEAELVLNSAYPGNHFGMIWACKESVYKVLMKRGFERFMNFKNIKVDLQSLTAEYNNHFFKLGINDCSSFIHAYTICENVNRTLKTIVISSDIDHYKFTTEYIKMNLSESIVLSKSNSGIPFTNDFNIDVSFSHDNNLTAIVLNYCKL